MKATSTLAHIRPVLGVKMRKSTAPPPPHNGNGSLSAEDSDSLSGESLEGSMELSVILPDGQVVQTSVERRTPMMDLLVQVTKTNGLSPGSFVLDVQRERSRNSALYKPNTPVGSLHTSILYLVPKSSVRDVPVRKDSKTGAQPFEKTFRLRVHLPRNQLHVLRVSQNTPLIDIFNVICAERELNSARYELRHPVHVEERLDPQRCLADYCLSEVAIVSVKEPSSAFSHSTSDIMALQQDDDRKKNRFFGFMFKKSKSVSKSIGDTSSEGHSSRGVSPARSDGSGSQSISPPPSTVGHSRLNGASNNSNNSNNNNNNHNNINNKLSKKRPAPPPPKAALPQSVPQSSVPPPFLESHKNGDAQTSGSHSRHSSDSSGYHEASILSESPEATMHDLVPPSEFKAAALVAKKTPVLTNLTTVNSNSSLSVLSGPKKRKAPAPPPIPVGNAGAENGSLSTPTSPTPGPATDSEMAPTDENRSSNIESVVTKGGQLNNDKSAQRSDSTSSHASSSSSEELKVVAPKVSTKLSTAPIPLPRQSKTPPVMCRTVVQEEVAVMEKKSETLSSADAGHDLNETITNVSDERLNFKDTDSDSQNGQSKAVRHETNSSISGTLDESVAQLNTENERLFSNCSLDSVVDNNYMDKHDAAVSHVVSLESNGKPCNWTSTKESHEAEVIAALRKMSVESESSSDSSDNTEIAVIEAIGDSEEHVVDRHASKKDSVVRDEYSDTEKIDKRLSVSSDQFEPTPTNAANSSRKSSTLSEIDMDVPEALNMELCAELVMKVSSEPETDEAIAHSDLFSFRECKDGGDMEEDLKTLPKNDESTANRFDDKNFQKSSTSSSESVNISSIPSKMQQEPHVKESDVIALNAQIDQTISEHKIAAEIDEAFAAIDLMDNESENGDDSSNSAVTSSDPIITWEYKIPEVPRQFQNDYEGTEQGSTNSSLQSTDSSKDQNPLKFAVDASKKEIEAKHYPKESSLIAYTSAENTATEKVDVQVRRVYRRPVVNFSISTYKARDEEEVRYGHKLTKVDSFSQKPNLISEPSVPQDSRIDSVASSFATSSKPKADHLVPGQSSAIAKVIAATNDSSATLIMDKSEAYENRPEGGMRKAKSELQLNNQTGSNLSVPNGCVTEQERLQQEYLKLHEQFLQWQQQLLQNQTILQQQQILPQSSTETLQRIQQLQQQIMSLPPQSTSPASQQQPTPVTDTDTKDYSQKTRSLPRPKPAATTNSTSSNGNSNSLERRLPRVGPRPWKPVAVSVSTWNRRPAETLQDEINKNSEKPVQIIAADKKQVSNGPSVSTEATVTKDVQKTVYPAAKAPLNTFNSEKSVNIVNKQTIQAPAFRRCPVVKGFAMDPQPKSRVIITSAKENPVTSELNGSSNVAQINGVHSKPGVVHVNISPKVTNLNLEKSKMLNYSKEMHANTLPSKTSKTERVYFGGGPTKPSVQTFTYFGDKVGTTTNKIAISRDTESTAVQKVANNVSLTKPKSYNFGSAMYSTEITEKSADKKFTTVVSLTPKQKTLQSIPPPPPPVEPIIVSQGTSVIKPANVESKKSPTSPTANGDFKDELMNAIRSFGGRSGLKKVSSSETQWENRHGKFN